MSICEMSKCPVCNNEKVVSICEKCGYDYIEKEISDKKKLISYLASLKKDKNWIEEVTVKLHVHDVQINKHGHSSTKSEFDGWSFRETGKMLVEDHSLIAKDIQLAKALDDYPQLKTCNNKTKAKRLLKDLSDSCQSLEEKKRFNYEKRLQQFLEEHWNSTSMGKEWGLYGSNFPTGEIGIIDLLAIHKDRNEWLVIELKKDQSSDETVGQILRYMGWVKENLLKGEGFVKGMIISHSADDKIKYVLSVVSGVCLKIYSFKDGKLDLEDSNRYYLKKIFSNMTKDEKIKFLNEA